MVATAAQQDWLSRQKCVRCNRYCKSGQRLEAAFGACDGHHHLWLAHKYLIDDGTGGSLIHFHPFAIGLGAEATSENPHKSAIGRVFVPCRG
jgi:hypothetical protein